AVAPACVSVQRDDTFRVAPRRNTRGIDQFDRVVGANHCGRVRHDGERATETGGVREKSLVETAGAVEDDRVDVVAQSVENHSGRAACGEGQGSLPGVPTIWSCSSTSVKMPVTISPSCLFFTTSTVLATIQSSAWAPAANMEFLTPLLCTVVPLT